MAADECACRPAVVVSFLLAGTAAFLSGLCYVEYVVDTPLTGTLLLASCAQTHASNADDCTLTRRRGIQLYAFDLWRAGCMVLPDRGAHHVALSELQTCMAAARTCTFP